jgi:hypothetical protein
MLNESTSSSSCSSFAGADAIGARGVDGDHALAVVPVSSVPRKVACESSGGAASVWKPGDGEEKTEKDRSRCSSTDDAPRMIPLPRRGDGDCGCDRDDSAKMAPTTTLSSTNHAAPEPSHAGSGQHHHPATAIIGAPSIACLA